MSTAVSKYAERDRLLKEFAGRYRVLINRFVEPLFFGGKTAGHITKRLVEDGTLTLHSRAIPGAMSFCTLSQKSVAELGLPKERANITPQGLDMAVGTLFWTKAGEKKRIRLEASEVQQVTGVMPPANVCYCASGKGDHGPDAVLWRVYQTSTGFEKTAETLMRHVEAAKETPETARLIVDGVLGFLVLADAPGKAKTLSNRFFQKRFHKEIRLLVAVGPTASTLHRSFRENWSPTYEPDSWNDQRWRLVCRTAAGI